MFLKFGSWKVYMQIVEGPFNWQRWEVGGAFKYKGEKSSEWVTTWITKAL